METKKKLCILPFIIIIFLMIMSNDFLHKVMYQTLSVIFF